MSENILLKECLDAFFKNLEDDASFPKDALESLKALRASNKLTKGEHLRDLLLRYNPNSETKS
jgi:hypothetical protein